MGSKAEPRTLYYRYEEDTGCGGITVRLRTHLLIRKTPKGAWISRLPLLNENDNAAWLMNPPRFVLDGPGKRFAHQRKEWALESLKRRKQSQVWRCELGLLVAKKTLEVLANPAFKVGETYPDAEISHRFMEY